MLALCEDWALLVIYSQWERNGLFHAFWPGLSGHRGLRVSCATASRREAVIR